MRLVKVTLYCMPIPFNFWFDFAPIYKSLILIDFAPKKKKKKLCLNNHCLTGITKVATLHKVTSIIGLLGDVWLQQQ